MSNICRVSKCSANFYRELIEFLCGAQAKGVRFLDTEVPNWRDIVDGDVLQMQDECGCVLGQLDENYGYFLKRTGRTQEWAAEHGFNIPALISGHGDPMAEVAYEVLTDCWREEIA